jgi:hypothetical protein
VLLFCYYFSFTVQRRLQPNTAHATVRHCQQRVELRVSSARIVAETASRRNTHALTEALATRGEQACITYVKESEEMVVVAVAVAASVHAAAQQQQAVQAVQSQFCNSNFMRTRSISSTCSNRGNQDDDCFAVGITCTHLPPRAVCSSSAVVSFHFLLPALSRISPSAAYGLQYYCSRLCSFIRSVFIQTLSFSFNFLSIVSFSCARRV